MKAGGRACLMAALAGAIVQPLDQRLRRAHQLQRRNNRAPAKSVGWNSGVNGWLACLALPKVDHEIDLLRQEFVGDFVDAEIDRRDVGADIVGEPFLQRGVFRSRAVSGVFSSGFSLMAAPSMPNIRIR